MRVFNPAWRALLCGIIALVLLVSSSASSANPRCPNDAGNSVTIASICNAGIKVEIGTATDVPLPASLPLFDKSSNSASSHFLSSPNLAQGSFMVGLASSPLVILDHTLEFNEVAKHLSAIDFCRNRAG